MQNFYIIFFFANTFNRKENKVFFFLGLYSFKKKNQLKFLKPKFARRWNISMNKKFYSKAREETLRRFQERRKMHNLSKKS